MLQINPVHILTLYDFKFSCDIILPHRSAPRASKWFPPFRFCDLSRVGSAGSSRFSHACYLPGHPFLLNRMTILISFEGYNHEVPHL